MLSSQGCASSHLCLYFYKHFACVDVVEFRVWWTFLKSAGFVSSAGVWCLLLGNRDSTTCRRRHWGPEPGRGGVLRRSRHDNFAGLSIPCVLFWSLLLDLVMMWVWQTCVLDIYGNREQIASGIGSIVVRLLGSKKSCMLSMSVFLAPVSPSLAGGVDIIENLKRESGNNRSSKCWPITWSM